MTDYENYYDLIIDIRKYKQSNPKEAKVVNAIVFATKFALSLLLIPTSLISIAHDFLVENIENIIRYTEKLWFKTRIDGGIR